MFFHKRKYAEAIFVWMKNPAEETTGLSYSFSTVCLICIVLQYITQDFHNT